MTKKPIEKEKTDAEQQKKKTREDQIHALQDEVESLQEEVKKQKDKLLRSYADFDNYKKRIQRDKESTILQLKRIYLSELLDVKELLLQALDDKNPKEGLRILLNQLEQFFESENVKYIDCIEKPFNHKLHHAVTTIEKPDTKDNTIVEEIKKGYLVGDYVLRPSHVIVSKKKCEEEEIQ